MALETTGAAFLVVGVLGGVGALAAGAQVSVALGAGLYVLVLIPMLPWGRRKHQALMDRAAVSQVIPITLPEGPVLAWQRAKLLAESVLILALIVAAAAWFLPAVGAIYAGTAFAAGVCLLQRARVFGALDRSRGQVLLVGRRGRQRPLAFGELTIPDV